MIGSKVMIYKGLKILSAFLSAALIVSCTEDSALQQGSVTDGILPIENTTVHQLGDSFKVAYTSPVDWRMTMKENGTPAVPEWLTASVVSGKAGTTVITFTVDPNVDEDRKCDINFSRKGDTEIMESFTIFQEKAVLEVSETAFEFGWKNTREAGMQTFNVESNVEWALTLNNETFFSAEYEGCEDGVAEGDRTVTVRALENNFSTENKAAVIKVVPVKRNNKGERIELGIDYERTISMSQDFLIFLVNNGRVTTDLPSFSELGADYVALGSVVASDHLTEQTITITSETDWEFDIDEVEDSWGLELTTSPEEENVVVSGRDAKRKTLTIKVKEPNPSDMSRNADFDLYVLADDVREKRTVKIHQDAYEFRSDLLSSDVSFDNLSGENTLSLHTKGPWSILPDDVPEWLSISPMNGVGNADIEIKAENQNLSFEDLKDDIKILSGLNTLTDKYSFSQDKFLFDVVWPDEFGSALSRLDTRDYLVYVTSSGPWTLELESSANDDGSDWVDVDTYSGEAGIRMPVIIKANNANPDKNSERGKIIRISSDLHESGSSWPEKALFSNEFIQDRFRFDLVRGEVDITTQPTNYVAYKSTKNTSTFTMRCSAPWQISTDSDWISFNLYQGTGEDYPSVTMTALNNVSGEWSKSRKAIVTVKSDPEGDWSYSDSKTFEVTQDGLVFEVSAQPSYSTETLNEQTFQFSVTATDGLPWTVSQDDSWVGLQSTSLTGSRTVSFKPTHNGSLEVRDSKITVSSSAIENLTPVTMSVAQSAYRFDSKEVMLKGFKELNPGSKDVAVDCMGPWTVQGRPSWIEVDQSSGSGKATLKVTPKKNTATGGDREGTFRIVSQVGGVTHTKVVTVVQDPFIWEVKSSTGNINADAVNGGTGLISFICSGSWMASSTKDFVTLSKASGTGGKYTTEMVSVTVSPNYTRSARSAQVTVRSDDDSAHSTTLSVSQAAYVFEIGAISWNIPYGGEKKTVTARCSELLNVISSASWLKASVSGDVLTLEADENETTSTRTATVTVSSPHVSNNAELTKTFTFTQAAAPAPEPEK